MNEAPHSDHGTLPLEVAQRLDGICDRFEKAWHGAGAPTPGRGWKITWPKSRKRSGRTCCGN